MRLLDNIKPEARIAKFAARGSKNAKAGNTFEGEIQKACNHYLFLDIAYIQKNATPTAWVPPKQGKPGFLIHTKSAILDFTGVVALATVLDDGLSTARWIKTWHPFFMEAKSTAEGELPIADKGGLNEGQLAIMKWLAEREIQVYLLWKIRKAETVFMLTPQQVEENLEQGARGGHWLSMEKCRESHIPRISMVKHRDNEYLDFLNVLGDIE